MEIEKEQNQVDFQEDQSQNITKLSKSSSKKKLPKKDLNKTIDSVKSILAATLKKSQKQHFNGVYNEMLWKIENSKKSFPTNTQNLEDQSILDYDFLKTTKPKREPSKKKLKNEKSYKSLNAAVKRNLSASDILAEVKTAGSSKLLNKKSSADFGSVLKKEGKVKKPEQHLRTSTFLNPNYQSTVTKNNKTFMNNSINFEIETYDKYRIVNDDINKTKDIDMYSKNQRHKFITEKILQTQRNQKYKEEISNMKEKPSLTKYTQKIIKKKFSKEKPIYQRYQEVIDAKNKELSIKRMIKYEEEQNICKEFSNMSQCMNYDQNHFESWLKDNSNWVLQKDEKVKRMKKRYDYLEHVEVNLTFKPQISKKSEKLARVRSVNNVSEMVDRLHNEHIEKVMRKNEMIEKSIPTFMPSVNNKIPKYIKVKSMIDNVFIDKTVNRDFFNDDDKEEVIEKGKIKHKLIHQEKYSKVANDKSPAVQTKKIAAWKTITAGIYQNENKIKNNININENLYRINIRDSSVWDKNKENEFLYDPSFDFVFKS